MTNDAARPGLSSTHEVGRYTLVCEIAKSQLGPLWVARNGSDLALVRRIPKAGMSEGELDWLSEVGWWAMELHHDHVATPVDVVATDSELAVASTYSEGEPLRSLLRLASFKRKPMPAPIALRVMRDLLDATAFAEAEEDRPSLGGGHAFGGLVPDSVLVGRDGATRWLDAGVGGVVARIESMARHPEMAAYAAPELVGDGEVDRRADAFSAGVMLWEMLTGKRLFVGANHAAVVERVKTFAIPRVDASKPIGGDPIPAPVADLVARALERDPAARFDGAAAMAEALRALGDAAVASPEEVASFVEEIAGTQLSMRRKMIDRKTGVATSPSPPVVVKKPAPVAIKQDSIHPDILDESPDDAIPVESGELVSMRFTSEPPTLRRGEAAPHFPSEPPTQPVVKAPAPADLDIPPPPASVLEAAGIDAPAEPAPGEPAPPGAEAFERAAAALEPAAAEALEPAAVETLEPATLEPSEDPEEEAPAQSAVIERRKRAQKLVIGVMGGMGVLIVLALVVSLVRKSSKSDGAAAAVTTHTERAAAPSAAPVKAPPAPAPEATETAAAPEPSAAEPAPSAAAPEPSAATPEPAPAPKPAALPAPAPFHAAPRAKPKPKHKFTPSGI